MLIIVLTYGGWAAAAAMAALACWSLVLARRLKRADAAKPDAADLAEALARAEEQARRAEFAEQLARLGVWRRDSKTNVITWSPQLYDIYGVPPDTVPDFALLDRIIHPDEREAGREYMRLQAQGIVPESWISRIVRPDGDTRWISLNAGIDRNPAGENIASFGTVVDITEQKTLEAQLRHALDQAEEQARRADFAEGLAHLGHWRHDIKTSAITWSPQLYEIFGLPRDTVLGLSLLDDMIHPDDREAGQAHLRLQAQGIATDTWICRIVRPDGDIRWLSLNSGQDLDADGGFSAVFGSVIDITEQKLLEAELRHARAEAEEAAAVKSEFLANMSHELRTPLTSIIGFTRLATEQSGLTGLTRTYVERVGDASRALLCTVNDILDFSKLESGQVSIQAQPVDLNRLTQSALDLFLPQAGAKDVDLILDSDEADRVVAIDPDRIRQILLNLVGNAVKFTSTGSVTLRTRYDATAEELSIAVTDTGAGIPQSKLNDLFKRFSQVDGSLTRTQGGTGLGLAICKGLVEAMGGRIGVDSQAGQGSCFWFTIPASPASLEQLAATGELEHLTCEGLRVLVVDDHAVNRQLARLFLDGAGADVEEAADGVQAVNLTQQTPYDVILMDLHMPHLDGRGALRRIRELAGPNQGAPILAFTAAAGLETNAQLTAFGFQGVISKPLEPLALIGAVIRAMSPPAEDAGAMGLATGSQAL